MEEEHKDFIEEFLYNALKAMKKNTPKERKKIMMTRLLKEETSYEATRDIVKICVTVEAWGGTWKANAETVRHLLAQYFSKKQQKDQEEAAAKQKEEEKEEAFSKRFWSQYKTRYDAAAKTAQREAEKLEYLDICCVEDLFDLYDLPEERDRFHEYYFESEEV